MRISTGCLYVCIIALPMAAGCRSSSYADRGTALGALGGAGIGALIGHATGHTGAGALIGTGVGAVTGSAVGTALDDIETRNRAEIAAQLGRPVSQGAATPVEVVTMTSAGVDRRLIINYVNSSGMVQPISAQDVIYLHEQGVNIEVIEAMQNPRVAQVPPAYRSSPQTVIIERDHYGPYWHPHFHYRYGCGCW